jgi:hypothetical protein
MANVTAPTESDLDRISRLIAEVDEQEFLLVGLDPHPVASPTIESALLALREEKNRLEEELAELWAKHCNQC